MFRGAVFLCLAVVLTGCASDSGRVTTGARGTKPYTISGKTYYPLKSSNGFSETGNASWYGTVFHGRSTASGEKYNQDKMTAAHKTLPFGTVVRVTNLGNKKSVVVRINDRGPFVRGRVIDVSRAAARQLDMIGTGTARVRIETVAGQGADTVPASIVSGAGDVYIQIGSFGNSENAQNLLNQVKERGYNARVRKLDSGLHAVHVGPWANRDAAQSSMDKLRAEYPGAFWAK